MLFYAFASQINSNSFINPNLNKMKKFLAIFFLAVLPLVAFTSCGDDDEKSDDPISDIEILGKYYSADYPDEYIELKENGVAIEYDGEGEVTYGTYVYDAPYITISFEDGEGDRYTYGGTISGNTMRLNEGVYVRR